MLIGLNIQTLIVSLIFLSGVFFMIREIKADLKMDKESKIDALSDGENIALANLLIALKGNPAFSCRYTNWRGETMTRRLKPIGVWYGSTKWHLQPQLMLKAGDFDKLVIRDFPLANIDTKTIVRIGEEEGGPIFYTRDELLKATRDL